MRDNPIRVPRLIPPRPLHKPSLAIDLQTPEDVLRPRDPANIGRVALVGDVDVAASACAAHAALAAGPAGARFAACAATAALPASSTTFPLSLLLLVVREEDAAAAQRGPGLRGVHGGLRLHVRIVNGVLGYDVVDDLHEGGILGQAVRSWRIDGCGTNGERGDGRVGGEEREEVAFSGFRVRVDVLVED